LRRNLRNLRSTLCCVWTQDTLSESESGGLRRTSINNSRLTKAYKQYNRRYFGNKLPDPSEVKVIWEDLGEQLMGLQDEDVITINSKHRRINPVWRGTLLHEMVHLKCPKRVNHGPKFQKEMMRLARLGALKDVW
jgi:hypothetical protein